MSNLSSPCFTLDALNSMKVVDLRQELDKRGLDKSGLKSELVKRLEKSLLDESSISNTDESEDKMETVKVNEGISELKDFRMESADNNDSMKGESFSESSVLDTNKNLNEETIKEKNQDNEEGKNKLANTDNIIKEEKNIFHKDEDKDDEEDNLVKGKKAEATEMVNGSLKVTDLENSVVSNKSGEEDYVMKNDGKISIEDNSAGKEPANRESDLLKNKENFDKTTSDKSPENKDQISKECSGQASKPVSNTVSTSSKESSEISESSERKKDSLLKSVKQNEDKKTDLSKCIWISGLSSTTKAVDLKDICCKIGKVVGAKVVTSAKTTGSQCFGFVTMASSDEAKRCIESLHKSILHENVIQVEMAKADPTPPKKSVEKKSEKQDDRSRSSRQSKNYRTSSSSRSTRRDDRGSRRDEKRTRDIPREKEIKKQVITIEDDVKNPDVASKSLSSQSSKNPEKIKNDREDEVKVVEESDKKDTKSADQLRKERAEKLEQEQKLREDRRKKEREKNRLIREEKRKEEEKREKERRERARKEAERVRKEREKQREAEKLREKERERERERFLQERKEREERERRERERERELLERERIEREKLERERKERERLELERIERERQEEERLEKERLARIERENRIEKERQRLEQERLDRERRERDRSRIIDRGIDRSIGNSLKRSAYDDRTPYYGDSKRSLREDSRDRPVYNSQPDVRRVVQRTDVRPFDRDRSPIRVEDQIPMRGIGRRDWLDVDIEANAPKTLSDVLGRAGLTGILGFQTENESYDIRPLNKQVDEEQYYLRNPNRIEDHNYRPDIRDSRDGNRVMHGAERFKERADLSDNRIEIKGLQRYDERRVGDSRKDIERRDNQNSSVFRARNDERVFREPPHMLNNDVKGAFRNSIVDRNGLHPASADLGGRGLSVVPPRMLPMSDVFGRPINQLSTGSNSNHALQAGYVAANGIALHQAAQNVSLRDNRLEYTQRARQPHSIMQNRRF